MATRDRYPVPECPKCGKFLSKIKQTLYSKNNEIVRRRHCDICDHRWWTIQVQEKNLNPETTKVNIPSFRNGANRFKRCNLCGAIHD